MVCSQNNQVSGRTFLCKHTTAVHLGALSHPCYICFGQGHLQSPPLLAGPASHVQLFKGKGKSKT